MENSTANSFVWREPWFNIEDQEELLSSVQRELDAEIGPRHPLWGRGAKVFGKNSATDDVLVNLDDNHFALVHLVWHGKVDQMPSLFPGTLFFDSSDAVQGFIDSFAQYRSD